MEKTERQLRKRPLVPAMLKRQSRKEAVRVDALPVRRAMVYRLVRAARSSGEEALQDGGCDSPQTAGSMSLSRRLLSRGFPHAMPNLSGHLTTQKVNASDIALTDRRGARDANSNPVRHARPLAVSLATVRKFCTSAEREERSHATAISVRAGVPSNSRYTTP